MKIDKRKDAEGKWYKYEGKVEFKIRPFKLSALGQGTSDVDNAISRLHYCLTEWRGLTNESDGELKCNEENRLHFFDYYYDVRKFIFKIIDKLDEQYKKEIKNS